MRYLRLFAYIITSMLLGATFSYAAPVKLYVAPFTVVGSVQDKEEAKVLLQSLLTAKLSDAQTLPVTLQADADAIIQGTYIVIGSEYSLDLVLLNPQNKALRRCVTSGRSNNPSYFAMLDTLVGQIKPEFSKISISTAPLLSNGKDMGKSVSLKNKTNADIIYAEPDVMQKNTMIIPRMAGEFSLIRKVPGEDQILLADTRSIKLIGLSDNVSISNKVLNIGSQIINVDCLSRKSGGTYIFVSYVHMDKVYTAIYDYDGKRIKVISEKEPFYTRVAKLYGKEEKLLIQEQGEHETPYYGSIYFATIINNKIVKGEVVPLPQNTSIYAFNKFYGIGGESLTMAYNSNGYIVVYDANLSPVWTSTDKFGASQLSFEIKDLDFLNKSGKLYRTHFINQHMLVMQDQLIIVGYNEPSMSIGDLRSYKKGVVYGFKWNGGALEEAWHTTATQNYMPDFEYDHLSKSIYLIQRTQGEGLFQKQPVMSSVLIKKVE